LAVKIRFLPA